jgi:hypothetical protein
MADKVVGVTDVTVLEGTLGIIWNTFINVAEVQGLDTRSFTYAPCLKPMHLVYPTVLSASCRHQIQHGQNSSNDFVHSSNPFFFSAFMDGTTATQIL